MSAAVAISVGVSVWQSYTDLDKCECIESNNQYGSVNHHYKFECGKHDVIDSQSITSASNNDFVDCQSQIRQRNMFSTQKKVGIT
jgi:hypothetical protein